jgi:pyruvate dehydrogenase E2 component (dihydrolipoamide acetyltransferase)
MAVEVHLPKLSDEMTEATISRWLKEVGESVDKGEPIVEVETEKVIVEVEAPRAGVIVEIVAAEQEVVPVDGLLCRIGAPGERTVPQRAARQAAPEAAPETAAAAEPAAQVAAPPHAAEIAAQAGGPAAAATASNVVNLRQRPAPAAQVAGRLRGGAAVSVAASPLARRVAEELGIDLTAVQGTGIGGKVVMADLQPYLEQPQSPAAPAPAPRTAAPQTAPPGAPQAPPASSAATTETGFADVPHSSLRRTIARRMSEAKGGIPHFYMTVEADVTEVLALRERLNAALSDGRVSVNDLMVKAAALALERVPALNATYTDNAVRRYTGVHIGVATAIDDGLVTPVLRDCQLKTVGRIARESAALIAKAHARTLAAEELQGGTFTVSNLGMTEVVEFAAIVNPPQVGILAIARPVERPAAHQGRVVLRKLLRATLSADHRAVDGVTGAAFLTAFKEVLEHPERLML